MEYQTNKKTRIEYNKQLYYKENHFTYYLVTFEKISRIARQLALLNKSET